MYIIIAKNQGIKSSSNKSSISKSSTIENGKKVIPQDSF